jgi:DNA-binding NarL/FixJ family response regulator
MTTPFAGPVRFLVVDDCTLYRDGLASHLAADEGDVRTAWDVHSLRDEIEDRQPDMILLNVGTRDSATLLRVSVSVPGARVIAVGVSEEDESQIVSCAESGVAGYHLRSESLDDLLTLIRRISGGESVCSPQVGAILLRRLSEVASLQQSQVPDAILTTREEEILRLLEEGMSNREIAHLLCIAVHTVKNHVHSILSKLGVRSRAEAAARLRTRDQSYSDWMRAKTTPAQSYTMPVPRRNRAAQPSLINGEDAELVAFRVG